MTMGGTRKREVELDGPQLEQVKEFVYLGSTATEAAKSLMVVDPRVRIAKATTALPNDQITHAE